MTFSEPNLSTKQSGINIESRFEKGASWSEYLNSCSKNVQRMEHIYNSVTIDDGPLDNFTRGMQLNVICISEDWCPDCVQNSALIAKMANQQTGIKLKFFFRDQNLDLMEQYLSNGKKVIPAIIFFDSAFNELGRWSGPCLTAKKWVKEKLLKGRPVSEIPHEELQSYGSKYDEKFLSEFYLETLKEIRELWKSS